MPPLSPWTVKLGNYTLQVIGDPDHPDAGTDARIDGLYAAQDMAQTLTRRDVVVTLNEFTKGAGYVKRRGPRDDGGLAWAEDGITWLNNGLYPGPTRNAVNLSSGLTKTDIAVTDSRFFDGKRFCITTGGYVFSFANDDPTQTATFNPALNAFADATHSLHAGYVCTAMEVFATTTGVPALYVAAYSSAANTTKIYKYTAAGGWTNTREAGGAADITNIKIDKLAPVFWEGNATAGAQRLVAAVTDITGGTPTTTGLVSNTLRHVIYGNDPMLQANWVTPIVVGNPGTAITKLLGYPQFVFAIKSDGIHTVNETRSMNLTRYWETGSTTNAGTVAALYRHGIVAARGFGLDYYDARQNYRLQEDAVEVGPMAGMQDGTPIRGQITSLVPHDTFMLWTLFNHENKTTYLGRAKPREDLALDVPNPWVHYAAEGVISPSAGVGQIVTHAVVSSPVVSGSTTIGQRTVNLWLFTADYPTNAGFSFALSYYKMPVGSGPLSLQVSSGTFSYTTSSKFYMTAQNWSDDLATKYVRRVDTLGSNVAGHSIGVYTRADGDPTSMATFPGTWALAGAVDTDLDELLPSTEVSGRLVGLLATISSGSSTPTILHSLSLRAKVVRPTFKVITLNVLLQRDYPLGDGTPDIADPDATFAAVMALQDSGQVDYIDEVSSTSVKVYVEQGARFSRVQLGDGDWHTVMQIELSVVS